MNNVMLSEVEDVLNALRYMLSTLSKVDIDLTPNMARELWLTYYRNGLEELRRCLQELLATLYSA